MDYCAISGGGGTRPAGVNLLRGPVGRPEAGSTVTRGNFTVEGALGTLFTTLTMPVVTMPANKPTTTHTVAVIWQLSGRGLSLQQNRSTVGSVNWNGVPARAADDGNTRKVNGDSPTGSGFHSLFRP